MIGIGPTAELNLRISVAILARVVFHSPTDRTPMLALEHKATLVPGRDEFQVMVKAQPFGGAIRILNTERLLSLVGRFNYDSQRSRSEQDFRIYVRSSAWETVRDYFLQNLGQEDNLDLDSDPTRELEEEFEDTIGIQLKPNQYFIESTGTIVENKPAPTANIHAVSHPTVRMYQIYHVRIHTPDLIQMMIANHEMYPGPVLQRIAEEDARNGGRGRANAILAVPIEQIRTAYRSIPPERRGTPLPFGNTLLEGNVAAVLGDVFVPKYSYFKK